MNAVRGGRPPIKNPWFAWLWDTGERGIRGYASAWATLVGADAYFSDFNLELYQSFVGALIGFIVEVMFSLAGKKRGAEDSASLLAREQDPPLTPVVEAPAPAENIGRPETSRKPRKRRGA